MRMETTLSTRIKELSASVDAKLSKINVDTLEKKLMTKAQRYVDDLQKSNSIKLEKLKSQLITSEEKFRVTAKSARVDEAQNQLDMVFFYANPLVCMPKEGD